MKLKKVFAGMAASAIAMTTFAMGSASTASAEANAVYNAGIAFQMDGTWNYRNICGDGEGPATFPGQKVGVQGAAYGYGSFASIGDTTIQYDGEYTVSISTNGTIDEDAGQTGWYIDEELGITRNGSPWSMLGAYEPLETDESVELTQDTLQWGECANNSTQFNHLLITTDIPCEINDDEQAVVNGNVVSVSNVTVDLAGTTYTAEMAPVKTDSDYLTIAIINNYADDASAGAGSAIDPTAMVTADGVINITFTLSGLGADPNAGGGESTPDSTPDSSSTNAGVQGNGTTSSSSSGTTSKSSGTTSTTTTTTSSTSDNIENAPAGAPAGIALALAAVAGAAIVVTRRK